DHGLPRLRGSRDGVACEPIMMKRLPMFQPKTRGLHPKHAPGVRALPLERYVPSRGFSRERGAAASVGSSNWGLLKWNTIRPTHCVPKVCLASSSSAGEPATRHV